MESNLWPGEAALLESGDIDSILYHSFNIGASDICFTTGLPVIAEIEGKNVIVVNRRLSSEVVEEFAAELYGDSSATTILKSGGDIDKRYSFETTRLGGVRGERIGLRVNMTLITIAGRSGIQITLRTLPSIPKSLDELGIEESIRKGLNIKDGLFLLTGPTGSGKSTTLAACIRFILESEEFDAKILEYSSPIEYVYDKVKLANSYIAQTEIPSQLISGFAGGVRNALRRKPSHILIGEARDSETIGGLVEAALTGHVALSTTHSKSVSSAVRRLLLGLRGADGVSEQDLIDSFRMIVTQLLVPKVGGGRVAVREYLFFSESIRESLLMMTESERMVELPKIVAKYGRSIAQHAEVLHEQGLITNKTLIRLNG